VRNQSQRRAIAKTSVAQAAALLTTVTPKKTSIHGRLYATEFDATEFDATEFAGAIIDYT
jgi:hypothetical protein